MSCSYGEYTALNDYLADRSYISGYLPSSADVAVFKAMSSAPDKTKYSHLARWYKHIQSYSDKEIGQFVKCEVPNLKASAAASGDSKKKADDDSDDDVDLFGSSDSEDEAAKAEKEARIAAYAAKKAKKPALIAKSSITLDVKPWGDETPMDKMEEAVRSLVADGLLWGASKLVPIGYGIKKLQIVCVVEDDKIGTDWLEENITAFEDYVQSVDVANFQKI